MRSTLTAAALALAALAPAHANTPAALPTDGSWVSFLVDDQFGDSSLSWKDDAGNPVTFRFVVPVGYKAQLTIVDLGFSGDQFSYTVSGSFYYSGGTGPAVAATYSPTLQAVMDPDAAMANADFSRGTIQLNQGDWSVDGKLLESLRVDGVPLNSTNGALRVNLEAITAVPEPATYALTLIGLGLLLGALRRKSA